MALVVFDLPRTILNPLERILSLGGYENEVQQCISACWASTKVFRSRKRAGLLDIGSFGHNYNRERWSSVALLVRGCCQPSASKTDGEQCLRAGIGKRGLSAFSIISRRSGVNHPSFIN
jgi:hypothetical protein